MNYQAIVMVVILALAVSSISMTLSKAQVFAGVRSWIMAKNAWFGELVSCPYCTSHWVAAIFVVLCRPSIFECHALVNMVVSLFTIVTLATYCSGLIYKAVRSMQQQS